MDRERLLAYLEGTLPEDEAEHIRQRLSHDDELRDELRGVRLVQNSLSTNKHDSFGPFFVDRVLRKLSSSRTADSLYDSLRWIFLRTSLAGLALMFILSILNIMDYKGLEITSSYVDAMFALPSTSIEDVLSADIF